MSFRTEWNYNWVLQLPKLICTQNKWHYNRKEWKLQNSSCKTQKRTLFPSDNWTGELKANRKLFPDDLKFEGAMVGARFSINTVICTWKLWKFWKLLGVVDVDTANGLIRNLSECSFGEVKTRLWTTRTKVYNLDRHSWSAGAGVSFATGSTGASDGVIGATCSSILVDIRTCCSEEAVRRRRIIPIASRCCIPYCIHTDEDQDKEIKWSAGSLLFMNYWSTWLHWTLYQLKPQLYDINHNI